MHTRHITSTNINEVYEYCRCKRKGASSIAVTTPGFMATTHTFDQRRLEESEGYVLSVLKQLPKEFRRSSGCTGLPWFNARHLAKHDVMCYLEVADRLLSMAAALNLITVLAPPEGVPCDVAYIIIEDIKLKRKYRLRKDERRSRWD